METDSLAYLQFLEHQAAAEREAAQREADHWQELEMARLQQ